MSSTTEAVYVCRKNSMVLSTVLLFHEELLICLCDWYTCIVRTTSLQLDMIFQSNEEFWMIYKGPKFPQTLPTNKTKCKQCIHNSCEKWSHIAFEEPKTLLVVARKVNHALHYPEQQSATIIPAGWAVDGLPCTRYKTDYELYPYWIVALQTNTHMYVCRSTIQ